MNDNPVVSSLPGPAGAEGITPGWEVLSPEDYPNVDALVIEDGKPVENIFAEKQQRLLVDPLYNSWAGPGEGRTFLALANFGLFYADKEPPLAPDVMLSLDVPFDRDLTRKENRSYLVWVMGKPPTVVFEFVSDRRGDEASLKLRQYARIGITHYVIFDPRNRLGEGIVRAFALRDGKYQAIDMAWLPGAELGLVLWEGHYEKQSARWLRWCDQKGVLIPTGRERADRAEDRAERLAARLRELGIEPEA
jgi:hypothetical protein